MRLIQVVCVLFWHHGWHQTFSYVYPSLLSLAQGSGKRDPHSRRLEIHCENRKARFIRYGTEEDADKVTIDVERCGLCAVDIFGSEKDASRSGRGRPLTQKRLIILESPPLTPS